MVNAFEYLTVPENVRGEFVPPENAVKPVRAVSLNIGPDGAPLEYGVTHFAGTRVTLTVAPD